MPAFVSLFNFTEQGVKNVKGTVERTQMIKKAAEAAGGRVIGVWWLMGKYDGILISEAPSEAAAMGQLIASGMQGNTRTLTMPAFSEDEMSKILAGLP
jgi:uncharacterized protein with GYD domain